MPPLDSLSALLQRWTVNPADAPGFAPAVWARIEQSRREERARRAFRWVLPLAASVAMMAGFGLARAEQRRLHAAHMAESYVRTIDPVQLAGHAPAHHRP